MAQRKRICYMCGKKYEYCPTCVEFLGMPKFMTTFHDENCRNVFQICTDYNMKLITKEEAKEKLSKCDLAQKDKFLPDAIATIDEIMGIAKAQKIHEVVD